MHYTNSPKYPKATYSDTSVYAIEEGKEKGFEHAYEYSHPTMKCDNYNIDADNLTIVFVKRFEGMSDPADSMIYFRFILDEGLKGYFLSTYGLDADGRVFDFLGRANQSK